MNILSGIAAAGSFVKQQAKKAAKAVASGARQTFSDELQRVQDGVAGVRTAVSQASMGAREAAADAIFKTGVGVGAETAARVAPKGNRYERALPFLESPEKRLWLIVGLVAAVLLIVYVSRRGR